MKIVYVIKLVPRKVLGIQDLFYAYLAKRFLSAFLFQQNSVVLGTFTGKALDHARTVSFSLQSGNRPNVSDYLLVITDGESNDDLTHNARLLRDNNVHVSNFGSRFKLRKCRLSC